MHKMDFGVIGLGVMGQNLARNLGRSGHTVAVYNRSNERTRHFMEAYASGKQFHAPDDLESFVMSLSEPRKVLLMVKAGAATDGFIQRLVQLLDRGDVLMDGGNAYFEDTSRRQNACNDLGIGYLGIGVSGGELGALYGPSIMVGGPAEAYRLVGPILESIAARGPRGTCCALLGAGAAGHYVKMVHNGIEYAVMQILSEAYDIMKRGLGMNADEMAGVLEQWHEGELGSYLLKITAAILRRRDAESGAPLLEEILDTAAQKGTGKWSSQSALETGSPSPTIAAAVFARVVSALKGERVSAEQYLCGPSPVVDGSRKEMLPRLRSAVLLATATAYAQGLRQIGDASSTYGYCLDLSEVIRVWMAGCIIRARMLIPMSQAFERQPDLPLLFLEEPFRSLWEKHQLKFRSIVAQAHRAGIPIPSMSSALGFVDAYRTGRLPANLLQAQRDFFGAHTYQRMDREGAFHTEWERMQ